jgi:hypothetical protein
MKQFYSFNLTVTGWQKAYTKCLNYQKITMHTFIFLIFRLKATLIRGLTECECVCIGFREPRCNFIPTPVNLVPLVLRPTGPNRVQCLFRQVLIRGVLTQDLSESIKCDESGCRLTNLWSHQVRKHWHNFHTKFRQPVQMLSTVTRQYNHLVRSLYPPPISRMSVLYEPGYSVHGSTQ